MLLDGGAMRKRLHRKGCSAAVFVKEPSASKIPSGCKAGNVLKGSFSLGCAESTLPGEGKRPKGLPLMYSVGPKPAKPSPDPDAPELKDERIAQEKLADAIRDLKVSRLDELTAEETKEGVFEEFYEKLVAEYTKHLPLLMANLKYLDSEPKRANGLPDVVTAAEVILNEINEDDLAMFSAEI